MTPRQRSDGLLAGRTWREATADVRRALSLSLAMPALVRCTIDKEQAGRLMVALDAMAAELDACRAAPALATHEEEGSHCRALAESAPPPVAGCMVTRHRLQAPRLP